jgi:signal transduction histidine kinase
LRETNATLRATKKNVDAKIQAKRDEVVGSVRAQLEDRLKALAGTNAKQALKKVRETIEEVVRPVSHELAKQVTNLSDVGEAPLSDKVRWRLVFVDSTSSQPFRPFLFSFWSGVATLCFAPIEWGFEIGVTLAFVTGLVAFAVLHAWAFLWQRFMTKATTTLRSVAFTVVLFATAMLDMFAISKVNGLEQVALRGTLPLGIIWMILGWGIALIPSLQLEIRRVVDSLAKSSTLLREELVRLNTAYRLQQQAIARALHGPIQDVLSVAAFKLSAAIKNNTADEKLIFELKEQITSTIDLLNFNDEKLPALDQSLRDLAEFWDGVAKITFKLSPAAKRLVQNHPVTSATAIELVREGCSNAVRHGKARNIKVLVAANRQETELVLRVSNDGELVTMKSKPGLGSKLLNELALKWSLESRDGETVLEALTPVI